MVLVMQQLLGALVVCLAGLECTLGMMNVGEMRDMMNNCVMERGFCINVIPPPPPPPPRRRQQQKRRRNRPKKGPRPGGRPNRGKPAGLKPPPGTKPAAPPNKAGAPPPRTTPPVPTAAPVPLQAPAAPAVPAWNQQSAQQSPMSWFDPFMWSMFTRKKRQAPNRGGGGGAEVEPPEGPGEGIQIRRGQNMYSFLNQHCRATEFDFGCQSTGGICCYPHLK